MPANHTPGPWRADPYNDIRTSPDGCKIAAVVTHYGTLNAADPNARLITAAPALLDALTDARRINPAPHHPRDRTRLGTGKSVSIRVDLSGRRSIKQKKT